MFYMRTIVYAPNLIVNYKNLPENSSVDHIIEDKESKEKIPNLSSPKIVMFLGGCVV